ncbi:recombinase family protein [Gordonia soli]|nr:recombinase family protein [Gordonia soli]
MALGYAREGVGTDTLAPQIDSLTEVGVAPNRIYTDVFDDGPPPDQRPGMTALLDYARPGDTAVVTGIDRLGRTVDEVMAAAREFADRRIGLRSLREGIDTDDPGGAMIVAVLASLGELDDERRRRRRPRHSGSRVRSASSHIGRPRALDPEQIEQARRMRAAGDPVPAIARALGVSRATLYRTLAEGRSVG